MKTVSIVIPTYNEEENVPRIIERVKKVFEENLQMYNYEIVFVDNKSIDGTRTIIEKYAEHGNHINTTTQIPVIYLIEAIGRRL